jgi:hypothetical protein
MSIEEKYSKLRPLIKDGDIIVFHGTGLMANIIQFCDKSWSNHVGIIFKSHGALFIEDSNANGVQSDRLSWRIRKYKSGDFKIIRPDVEKILLHEELSNLLMRGDAKWIQYDFINGAKELSNRLFKTKFKISLTDKKAICSSYTAKYAIGLDIVSKDFTKLAIVFPEDYLRYLNKNKAFIIE